MFCFYFICFVCKTLHGREDIAIATWNVRTLRAADKVEELLHEMDRYKWSILGLLHTPNFFSSPFILDKYAIVFSILLVPI